jgi:hypothetical protein
MKKIILTLIIGLALASCQENTLNPSQQTGLIYNGGLCKLEIYEVNGCQYIGYLHGVNNDVLTHMGNCNNPIHNKQ